jgi:hypothetical protein
MKGALIVVALLFAGCVGKIPVKVRVPDDVITESQLRAVHSCKYGCSVYDANLKSVGSWGFMALKSHWVAYAREACVNRCEVIPYAGIRRALDEGNTRRKKVRDIN